MYLKSLELSGFKSFAKKATISFSTPITGIVGPNGSGKSNTAEAFRFVLGEQSIKSLRGKRGEDMIWNGGGESASSAGRANRASVKLTFDNSGKLFPTIDFDEVSLERVVHRDNSNEYLLNGSSVRLKDIVELLASAHIGATGHHIISQGEADRILGASIRERREMIEDALGLKIYQWKKLESLRKLEKTEENMKQVESLRREIAPHLKFLKKQVEKVMKAEELRQELIALYRAYFACQDSYLKSEKNKIESELAGPKRELEELEKALTGAKKILTDSKSADQKSDELIKLEGKLQEIRLEKDKALQELGQLNGEISANRRVIEKEEERQKREEFQTVYLKDVEEVIGRIEKLEIIVDAKSLLAEIIKTLKGFVSGHRVASHSALVGEAHKEIENLVVNKKKLEEKVAFIGQGETDCLRQYGELKSFIEKEKDTDRQAERDVFRIIARQNEVRNIFNSLNIRLENLKRDEADFRQALGEAGMVVGREAVEYQGTRDEGLGTRESQSEKRRQIERLKIRLEESGAAGGAEVTKEYKETEERDIFLGKELDDLSKARDELHKLIAELDVRIDYEFKSGILKINTEFQKYFNLMFGGGRAELLVVKEAKRKKVSDEGDLSNLLSGDLERIESAGTEENETNDGPEGLDVNVSLPRKKVKGLMMLSGGERALTSIALLFAVSQVNPPPFIILDETDAALDEANSKKYGDMIQDLSRNSQLILITHNRETMSRAGVIYGVTMGGDGASRLLSIAFEEAVAVAK